MEDEQLSGQLTDCPGWNRTSALIFVAWNANHRTVQQRINHERASHISIYITKSLYLVLIILYKLLQNYPTVVINPVAFAEAMIQ